MKKFIAIGDPHFRTEALDLVDKFIEQTLQCVREERPDFVVCLGDTLHCHEKLHTSPLNKAVRFFKDISELCDMFVCVGNHDMQDNTQFLTNKHWLNCLKGHPNIYVADKVLMKYNCVFVPYVPNGRFAEALNGSDVDWMDADVIFAHQEFFGCKMGAIESTDGDKWDESWPVVITGHVHERQTPQPNVIYPGSSVPTAFGDSTKKGLLISTTINPKEHEYFILNLPVKKTVKVDLKKKKVPKLETNDDEEIRAIIEGDQAEIEIFKESETFKEMERKGVKVVLRPKLESIDEDRKQSLDVPFAHEIINYIADESPGLTQVCKEMLECSELPGKESLAKLLDINFMSESDDD